MAVILVDTRQHEGKHEVKHSTWSGMGHDLVRSKLVVGDYCAPPRVSVDTKQNIQELYMDLVTDHDRFRRECELAKRIHTHLWVLVENTDGVTDLDALTEWKNPRWFIWKKNNEKRRAPYHGDQLAKIARTMNDKYGVVFDFCTPDESPQRVLDILSGRRAAEWDRR